MAAPKKPKKRASSVGNKTTKESKSISDTSDEISKAEKANINQLLAQAFYRFKEEEQKDLKVKHKELGHLAIMAEEYLSTFALIGYSLQGEEVVMFNMPTSKDEAALVDLLRCTFFDIVSKRP
jgi:hypothetical protein